MVLERTIRILTEPAIGGAPRRLHVGDVPMGGTEDPQERFRMHGARANLGVERLLDRAAPGGPELRQFEDQPLKRHHLSWRTHRVRDRLVRNLPPSAKFTTDLRSLGGGRQVRLISRNTRVDFRSFSRCMAICIWCARSSSRSTAVEAGILPSINGLQERAAPRNARAAVD